MELDQRSEQNQAKRQEIREFTELIKELRKENKGLRAQLKEPHDQAYAQNNSDSESKQEVLTLKEEIK